MTHRRLLVLVIIVYVTLDLSLPAMPGAFVFEPADSAETTQIRVRGVAETVVVPSQARDPGLMVFQPPLEHKERLAQARSAERRVRPVVSWQSRAPYDSALPSEDPH